MFKASFAILIVAAGRGSRAQTELPKQYAPLLGKPLLTWTIEAIQTALPKTRIVTVIHPDDQYIFEKATSCFENITHVFGGGTRQESVMNGLSSLKGDAPDYVLVHDAARPFVTPVLIESILQNLQSGAKAVVPALAVTDTLKRVASSSIEGTIDRTNMFAVQTPQAFKYQMLMDAHTTAPHKNLTDDAAVFEAAGHKVHICTGDDTNFKITRFDDFKKAETHIMNACADVRVGSGYDVHCFEEGDGPWLCGIKVPYSKSLKGHSDADVGLHALTDAILAAIAEGDIGSHFPPSDKKWRGVDSTVFLKHAASLLQAKGGFIAHVAVCLICEKPKISPHKDAMRARIAEILNIAVNRVSVQATTTEKLGFTGREEGIAAQATATIRLPVGAD